MDPLKNVSGISAVTQFIIDNNINDNYIHFELGKKDSERGGIFRLMSVLSAYRLWKNELKKHPEALIHYNFPLSTKSILRDPIFIFHAARKRRDIIIHLHGGLFLTSKKIPFLLNLILKKIFSLNIPFIVLSNLEVNLVNRFCPKTVITLPNCVDISHAMRHQRNFNMNKPLAIGYIGRITDTKGMDYLLEACKKLKKQNIPFILKIAGAEDKSGKYIPLFYSNLGKQFVYDGIVSGEKKHNFLADLDIFILPSFFEGLPISLLECMSYGVVPVTTKVGSISEVIKEHENGIYIKMKDSQSIVDTVINLHNDRKMLQYLGKNARETIINQYSPLKYIKSLRAIYNMAKKINP